jgi:transcriptional pleiotropic regulator of transition state genes
MKATGIVRKIDELGRFVIPKEIRRVKEIEPDDALEIFVSEDKIILKKYEPACIFCGNADEVLNFKGKNICISCIKNMNKSTNEEYLKQL